MLQKKQCKTHKPRELRDPESVKRASIKHTLIHACSGNQREDKDRRA